MQIIFEPDTKADLDFFIKAGNKSILKKITNLIEAIIEDPFEGLGTPEPLSKENYKGTSFGLRSIVRKNNYSLLKRALQLKFINYIFELHLKIEVTFGFVVQHK